MTSEEIGVYLMLAGYGALVIAAIKVFGLRRVLWVIFGIVFLAVVVAFSTLAGIGSARR